MELRDLRDLRLQGKWSSLLISQCIQFKRFARNMSQETHNHNAIFLTSNKDQIIPISNKKSYSKPCVRTEAEEPLVLFGLGISLLIGRCANF